MNSMWSGFLKRLVTQYGSDLDALHAIQVAAKPHHVSNFLDTKFKFIFLYVNFPLPTVEIAFHPATMPLKIYNFFTCCIPFLLAGDKFV